VGTKTTFGQGQDTATTSPVLNLSGCDGLVGAIWSSTFHYDTTLDYINLRSWNYVDLKTPGLDSRKKYNVHMTFTHIQHYPQITMGAWRDGAHNQFASVSVVEEKISFSCSGMDKIRLVCHEGSFHLMKIEFHEQN